MDRKMIDRAMNMIDDEYLNDLGEGDPASRKKGPLTWLLIAACFAAVLGAVWYMSADNRKGTEPTQIADNNAYKGEVEDKDTVASLPADGVLEYPAGLEPGKANETEIESIRLYNLLLEYYNRGAGDEYMCQKFADDFGGAYIADNRELVILLIDDSGEAVQNIRNLIGDKGYSIRTCEYSYVHLLNTIDRITELIPDIQEHGIAITSVGEDVKNNRVFIGIQGKSDEDVAYIRELIDDPVIVYLDIPYEEEAGTPIKGGYSITSSSDGYTSKIGFSAINSANYEGFIISGHEGDNMYENFTYGSITAGYVTATSYYNTSTADASFIMKGASADTSAFISSYLVHSVSATPLEFPVGTSIIMYNAVSGFKYGQITNNDYISVRPNTWYFRHQTKSSIQVVSGDSGSPVFFSTGMYNGNISCKLLGIVATTGIDSSGTSFSTFSKYYYITQELSVTAVTQ